MFNQLISRKGAKAQRCQVLKLSALAALREQIIYRNFSTIIIMNTRDDLLRKAIACYEKAGQIEDVCRCLQALGEYVEAAERYEQNNEPWQAAWMYAEGAHLFYRARYLVRETPVLDLADELSHDLILARCDAQIGSKSQAGLTISKVIGHFPQLPLIHRQRIEEWAVKVAQHLGRFDLVATTYAIAYTTGTPESEIRWEAWALSTLGDATGVPTTPSVEPDIPFEFETVTVNRQGEIIQRRRLQAKQRIERLNDEVTLEMVFMKGGTFMMGSPEDEEGREFGFEGSESPQHQVTIKPFYMSKYPITQAQWIAVMGDNPSHFKGDNRPVENVSWHSCVEFCKRLFEKTGKAYRLPSESEWEYACRAGTTTPFCFGETITTDLANYYGDFSYASEPKGVSRGETTDVGSFPPNAFGLYDMHGNVLEWCADLWHENYDGAPTDGSAWLEKKSDKGTLDYLINCSKTCFRSLRGGYIGVVSNNCRAAFRFRFSSDIHLFNRGFRGCSDLD